MGRILTWLGLGNRQNNESLPLWHGVDEKTKWGSLLVCMGIAFVAFLITNWLLEGTSSAPTYLALLISAGTLLISTLIAERSLTRVTPEEKSHEGD